MNIIINFTPEQWNYSCNIYQTLNVCEERLSFRFIQRPYLNCRRKKELNDTLHTRNLHVCSRFMRTRYTRIRQWDHKYAERNYEVRTVDGPRANDEAVQYTISLWQRARIYSYTSGIRTRNNVNDRCQWTVPEFHFHFFDVSIPRIDSIATTSLKVIQVIDRGRYDKR